MKNVKKLIPLLFIFAMFFLLAACSIACNNAMSHRHHCINIKAKEATCLGEGNIEYWVCRDCDKLFANEYAEEELSLEKVIIPKTSHTVTYTEAKEATCATAGNLAYWSCSYCYTYFADENCTEVLDENKVNIPKKAHDLEYTERLEPVDWENGNVEYWYCKECENYYSDAECMNAIDQALTVIKSPYNIPDFVVEVAEGKNPVVLQLSDTQIIDAGQARPGRTGVYYDFWATDQIEERCYDYLTEVIMATKPDFIIITGDVVYGEFDDSGTALTSFINFMESFQIPWSPVFGNHDNESKKGVDWQCEQFENAQYCLFEQKSLTGNGNYSVAIAQGGALKRVFYMLDSNGCGAASEESLANGHTTKGIGFGADQIAWYTEEINELKKAVPDVKISFAYHIQQKIFEKAYTKYGFIQSEKYQDINIDIHPNKTDTDFGYIGRQLQNPWDSKYTVYNGMKKLGVDSIFVGHEHFNNAGVVYDGIRFQFGLKSSEYDRFNWIDNEGKIIGGYIKTGTSLVGGTVIVLSEDDSSIQDAYNYYCGFENGKIDWSVYEEKAPVFVNGLQYGGVNATKADLYADGAVTAEAMEFDDTTNAYKVTANAQGKLYVNTALLKGKTTFTFTVYMPSTSSAKLGGLGQFAIRTKPNDAEPSIDGETDGFIDYDTDSTLDSLKLKYDEWQTFTVDISKFQESCTEFAFVIAQGNTIYLRDLAVS